MAEDARFQVRTAAVRIDERTIVVLGDRIDRQIASDEILFERDVFGRVELEPAMSGAVFRSVRARVLLFVPDAGRPGNHGRRA